MIFQNLREIFSLEFFLLSSLKFLNFRQNFLFSEILFFLFFVFFYLILSVWIILVM